MLITDKPSLNEIIRFIRCYVILAVKWQLLEHIKDLNIRKFLLSLKCRRPAAILSNEVPRKFHRGRRARLISIVRRAITSNGSPETLYGRRYCSGNVSFIRRGLVRFRRMDGPGFRKRQVWEKHRNRQVRKMYDCKHVLLYPFLATARTGDRRGIGEESFREESFEVRLLRSQSVLRYAFLS